MELQIGKKYIYTMSLSEERNGEIIAWKKAVKVKYLGNVNEVHPELGVTHCAKHMFIGAEEHEDGFVFANLMTLADFDLCNVEALGV